MRNMLIRVIERFAGGTEPVLTQEAHSIPVKQIDFSTQAARANRSSPWRTSTASALFALSGSFRRPFDASIALFTQGFYVTPGNFIKFSENELTDKAVKTKISLLYYTIGAIGTVFSLLPWGVGVGLEKMANRVRGTEIHYHQSNLTLRKQKEKPLTLLTRNIAALPRAISNHSNLRPIERRLSELIAAITHPREKTKIDVLCLQETFGQRNARALIRGLSKTFKYFLYDIAPRGLGLDSGLFFASNYPIVEARFIRPPLPMALKSGNFPGVSFSIESITHKGILYVVIQQGDQHHLVLNAHIKSNISFDHAEAEGIDRTRGTGLRAMTQGLFDYMDELECRGISITDVYLGGDLNVSDIQETSPNTNTHERSGMHNGVRVRHGLKDYSFLFEGLFPNPPVETWLMNGHHMPIQRNGTHQVMPGVTFDHVGFFQNRERKGRDGKPQQYATKLKLFDDQGYSKGQDTPASDHAGILQQVVEQRRTRRTKNR